MKTRRKALATVFVLALMGLFVVVTIVRPSSALSVRCLKVAPFEGALMITLQVSNRTSRVSSVLPVRLERYEDGTWKKCPDGDIISTEIGDPTPHGSEEVFCLIRSQPQRAPLRLVVSKVTTRQGLTSFPGRVWLRLSGKNKTLPLNPLDNTLMFRTYPAEIIVELVAP